MCWKLVFPNHYEAVHNAKAQRCVLELAAMEWCRLKERMRRRQLLHLAYVVNVATVVSVVVVLGAKRVVVPLIRE